MCPCVGCVCEKIVSLKKVPDPLLGMGCEFCDASYVTNLFWGWGGEFCDRAFFRDGVASFVTEPFFGMGSRVV